MDDILLNQIFKTQYSSKDIKTLGALVILIEEDDLQDYLLIACQHGNIEFLKIMIQLGVNLNFNNFCLLRESASYGKLDCARFLRDLYNFDIETFKSYSSYSVLKKL